MPEESIQAIIDGIRSRVQAELDAQLGAIAERHTRSVDEARHAADAEAEQRWAARLASIEAEWTARAESGAAAARAEAEREWSGRIEAAGADWSQRLESELAAVRRAAEQQFAADVERVKNETEQAAASRSGDDRFALQQALEAERERAQALEAGRQQVERALADARTALESERRAIERTMTQAVPGAFEWHASRLLDAMGAIETARSLSEVLSATASAAAAEAPRAAVFVVNGSQIDEWALPGSTPLAPGPIAVGAPEAGILGQAVIDGEPHTSGSSASPAPAFARLPEGRGAFAVPLRLGAQPVGVLYADEGDEGVADDGWRKAVQILGRHASACLAFLTAARMAQAMRLRSGVAASQHGAEEVQGARRYARLLVSEIKLYNEAAVRLGREKRDLARRLKSDIDRAQRLFEERIPSSVPGRSECFRLELVQTLADGDPALLG